MGKLFGLAVVALAVLAALNFKDISRYLRIRAM
ncbi:MAG: DUF6893 family small protein [Chloroflexota bacterium]